MKKKIKSDINLESNLDELLKILICPKTGSKLLFDKIKSGKIKIEIFKKYNLDDVIQAHKDLEARKILGPAIIVPN